MTTPDEDYLWERRCRQVYALLREAGLTAREERLNLFRWVVHDPTVSSTNDLSLAALNAIANVMTKWKRDGELIEQAHAHIGPMQGREL